MVEQTSEKDIKQKQNNHNDEEIEIDLIGILRKIIGIRKTIYKAAGIGLVVGIIENVRKNEEEIQKNIEIKNALEQIGFSNGGDNNG